jgi:DNA repair protein RecO (recombination protein O)
MSEIVKTEAIVLSKMNYGDSSSIASLLTEDLGKISVIVKGARSPKSKYGKIVDPIELFISCSLQKGIRELQLFQELILSEHSLQ